MGFKGEYARGKADISYLSEYEKKTSFGGPYLIHFFFGNFFVGSAGQRNSAGRRGEAKAEPR
jgi:hypothetical protein